MDYGKLDQFGWESEEMVDSFLMATLNLSEEEVENERGVFIIPYPIILRPYANPIIEDMGIKFRDYRDRNACEDCVIIEDKIEAATFVCKIIETQRRLMISSALN